MWKKNGLKLRSMPHKCAPLRNLKVTVYPKEIEPLLTRTQVRAMFCGIASNNLLNWETSGKLPPPVKLSEPVTGWRRSTMMALPEKGGAR